MQVDVDAIAERHRISAMNDVVRQLSAILEEWQSGPVGTSTSDGNGEERTVPEIDLGKVRSFEFQEDLQKRELVRKGLKGRGCVLCANFEEHVSSHHPLSCAHAPPSLLRLRLWESESADFAFIGLD